MSTKLVYDIHDRPKFPQLLIFAFQQLLAIMAATITVPMIVGNGMSASSALFGAGVGTLVYQLFTKFRSPVFLGSSFAFIGPMLAAFAGAAGNGTLGYLGLVLGTAFAALVYVILALVVKLAGTKWINKVMPTAVIGPTVALIGLSLAGAAVNDVFSYGNKVDFGLSSYFEMKAATWVSVICARWSPSPSSSFARFTAKSSSSSSPSSSVFWQAISPVLCSPSSVWQPATNR